MIPVKHNHFYSCTKIYTNIFVESSIYLYCQYTKKAKEGVLYQLNFIYQSNNSSGTLSKSDQTFTVISKKITIFITFFVGICIPKLLIYQSHTKQNCYLFLMVHILHLNQSSSNIKNIKMSN